MADLEAMAIVAGKKGAIVKKIMKLTAAGEDVPEEMRANVEEYSGKLVELKERGEATRKAKKRVLRLAAIARRKKREEEEVDYLDASSSAPSPTPFQPDWGTKPLGASDKVDSAADKVLSASVDSAADKVLSASDDSGSTDSDPMDTFSAPATSTPTASAEQRQKAARLAKTFLALQKMILEGEMEGLIKKEKEMWEKKERVRIEREVREEMKLKEKSAREGYMKALEE